MTSFPGSTEAKRLATWVTYMDRHLGSLLSTRSRRISSFAQTLSNGSEGPSSRGPASSLVDHPCTALMIIRFRERATRGSFASIDDVRKCPPKGEVNVGRPDSRSLNAQHVVQKRTKHRTIKGHG